MPTITVQCWACGSTQDTNHEGPPEFGTSVALAAISVGWKCYADIGR